QALWAQARALATRAGRGRGEPEQPVAGKVHAGVFEPGLQVALHAAEVAFAFDQLLALLRAQLGEGMAERNPPAGGEGLDLLAQQLVARCRTQAAIEQRAVGLGDELGGVEFVLEAQALAGLTGTIAAVERE